MRLRSKPESCFQFGGDNLVGASVANAREPRSCHPTWPSAFLRPHTKIDSIFISVVLLLFESSPYEAGTGTAMRTFISVYNLHVYFHIHECLV